MTEDRVAAWPAPPLPKPQALRLITPRDGSRVAPPFSLPRWSDADDADLALLLSRPSRQEPTLDEVAAQIPPAASLRRGALLVVLGELPPSGAVLGRLLGTRVRIPRSLRCTGLLARGYTRVGGGVDPKTGQDLAWGYA